MFDPDSFEYDDDDFWEDVENDLEELGIDVELDGD